MHISAYVDMILGCAHTHTYICYEFYVSGPGVICTFRCLLYFYPSCLFPITPLPINAAALGPAPPSSLLTSLPCAFHIFIYSPPSAAVARRAMTGSPVELTIHRRDRERTEDMDLPGPFLCLRSACHCNLYSLHHHRHRHPPSSPELAHTP